MLKLQGFRAAHGAKIKYPRIPPATGKDNSVRLTSAGQMGADDARPIPYHRAGGEAPLFAVGPFGQNRDLGGRERNPRRRQYWVWSWLCSRIWTGNMIIRVAS